MKRMLFTLFFCLSVVTSCAMTPITTPEVSYTATGEVDTYTFLFRVWDDDDLVVTINDEVQTLGADYSVTGVGDDAGGAVVFTTAPAAGAAVEIIRQTPIGRSTDYTTGGPLRASTLNDDLDKVVTQVQDLDYLINGKTGGVADQAARSIKLPAGDTTNPTVPEIAARAGKVLGFDDAGATTAFNVVADLSGYSISKTPLADALPQYGADGGLQGSNIIHRVATLSDLQALTGSTGRQTVYVEGRTVKGDGYQGVFAWSSGDQSVAVGADIQSGVTVAGGGDATGESGAWVRLDVRTIDVRWFGAVDDGTTDNYAAFVGLSNYVNSVGAATIDFSGGTYYVGQYHSTANSNTDPLLFTGCAGITINGNGATIQYTGNFSRTSADVRTFSGLIFSDCENVIVRNLTLDGDLASTTNLGSFSEPTTHGVYLLSVENFLGENLKVYNFAADGLNIRDDGIQTDPRIASKYVKFVNSTFDHNGRQGASIVQGRNLLFENCRFSYTGRTAGFSPAAGVDVEPNRSTETAGVDRMDVNTGDVTFINCIMEENAGSQFVAAEYFNIDGVRLSGCIIRVGDGSTAGSDRSIFDVPGFVMENSLIDGGNASGGYFAFGYQSNDESDLTVRNNRFVLRTDGTDMVRSLVDVNMLFEGNTIVHEGQSPVIGTQTILNVGNTKAVIKNNRFFINSAVYTDSAAGDRQIMFGLNAMNVSGNVYETDLAQTDGGAATAHFANSYGAATIVENETYKGTNTGSADTFRPSYNSTFDTRYPYNKNGNYQIATLVHDFALIAAGNQETVNVTVPGIDFGDMVAVSLGRSTLGLELSGYVSGADTVTVILQNNTGVGRDLASSTIYVNVRKVN